MYEHSYSPHPPSKESGREGLTRESDRDAHHLASDRYCRNWSDQGSPVPDRISTHNLRHHLQP